MRQLKKIGQGKTAEIYDYDNGKVLKLFYKAFPDEYVKTEYDVSSKLSALYMPVPNAYEIVEYENRKGIIFEKLTGNTLMQDLSKKPWTIKSIVDRMVTVYNEFSRINIDCLRSFKEVLLTQITSAPLLSDTEKELVLSYVKSVSDGNKVCHGDFHPDNIIVNGDDVRVIDWLTAVKGPIEYDIARTYILLTFGTTDNGISGWRKKLMDFGRKALVEEYIRQYELKIDRNFENMNKWNIILAAARLSENIPSDEKSKIYQYIISDIGND